MRLSDQTLVFLVNIKLEGWFYFERIVRKIRGS